MIVNSVLRSPNIPDDIVTTKVMLAVSGVRNRQMLGQRAKGLNGHLTRDTFKV